MSYKITTAKEGQREIELIKPINLYVSVEHGSYLRPEAWCQTSDARAVLTSAGVHGKQLFINAEMQVLYVLVRENRNPPQIELVTWDKDSSEFYVMFSRIIRKENWVVQNTKVSFWWV